MQIPDQKAQTAACQRHGEQGVAGHLQPAANQGEDQHCHQRHSTAESVYAVRQIDGIGQVEDHQHHHRIVEPADVKPHEHQINGSTAVAQPVHGCQPENGCHHLKRQLLFRGQTLVLFLCHLGKVINEADDTEQQAEDHAAHDTERLPIAGDRRDIHAAGHTVDGIARCRCHNAAHNEQNTAHGGSALFVGMPLGAEFHLDGLPEFQFMQPGDERFSAQRCHRKRQHSYKYINPERHFQFPPLGQKSYRCSPPDACRGSP